MPIPKCSCRPTGSPQHLNDPSVRIDRIERGHTALRLRPHPWGRERGLDVGSERPDPPRLHHARGIRAVDVADRRDQGHDGRVLRRQEQLVGLLCLLGVPAVRPHQRAGDGRRPHQVGKGTAAGHARRAELREDAATRPRNGPTPSTARSATKCSRTCRRSVSSSTCGAPTNTRARACTCPTTPTKARSAAATSPAPRASPGRARSIPTTARSRAAEELKKIYVRREAAVTVAADDHLLPNRRAQQPHLVRPQVPARLRERPQLRRLVDGVGQHGGSADRKVTSPVDSRQSSVTVVSRSRQSQSAVPIGSRWG